MIEIVTYDPRWPAEFAAIATPLRTTLGELALRLDHIGSTSVPGLAAKDKIDIQVTVAGFQNADQLVEKFAALGYTRFHFSSDFAEGSGPVLAHDHRPPLAHGPNTDWEKLFFIPPASQRPTNVHVRAQGRANQRYPLLFRDYLRTHPLAVAAYAKVKETLARLRPNDVDFYYDIKDPVCDVIIEAAETWVQLTNWTMSASDS